MQHKSAVIARMQFRKVQYEEELHTQTSFEGKHKQTNALFEFAQMRRRCLARGLCGITVFLGLVVGSVDQLRVVFAAAVVAVLLQSAI